MEAFLLGLLVVFGGCQMWLFMLAMRISDGLADRHPEVWRSIAVRNLSFRLAVFWFVFFQGGQTDGDPPLTALVRTYRTLWLCGVGAFVTVVAVGAISDLLPRRAP